MKKIQSYETQITSFESGIGDLNDFICVTGLSKVIPCGNSSWHLPLPDGIKGEMHCNPSHPSVTGDVVLPEKSAWQVEENKK